jgi:hypothetical protein
VQLWNADAPMVLKVSGNVILVKLVQLWNAPFEMVLIDDGIIILFKFEQPLNADASMVVIDDDNVTIPLHLVISYWLLEHVAVFKIQSTVGWVVGCELG